MEIEIDLLIAKQRPVLLRNLQVSTEQKPKKAENSEIESTPEKKSLYCVVCHWKITNENQKIAMGGKAEHTFFNPHGMVFHIGCFKEAQGCGIVGTPSSEFSWFPGYHWQIAHCSNCHNHLGWLFLKGVKPHFFGLILAQLKSK
jgi:hypothetical protein